MQSLAFKIGQALTRIKLPTCCGEKRDKPLQEGYIPGVQIGGAPVECMDRCKRIRRYGDLVRRRAETEWCTLAAMLPHL